MKTYRTIVIVLSIVMGVGAFLAMLILPPYPYIAVNSPVTEEYYEMLKENAMEVAVALDENVIESDELIKDYYHNNSFITTLDNKIVPNIVYTENELIITVETIKAKVTAEIPISNYSIKNEDGIMKIQGIVELDKVEYIEETEVNPIYFYILLTTCGGALIAFATYILFFKAWFQER